MSDETPEIVNHDVVRAMNDDAIEIVNHDVVRAMTDDAILYAFRYLESAQAQVLQMLTDAHALVDTDPEKSAKILAAAEEKSRFNDNLERSLKELRIVVHDDGDGK